MILEVMVPEDTDTKEFIEETKDFAFNIVSMHRVEPIHYMLKYGNSWNLRALKFKIRRSCTLKMQSNTCSCFEPRREIDPKINRLIYCKSANGKTEVGLENATL
jgi:hypothetical protein